MLARQGYYIVAARRAQRLLAARECTSAQRNSNSSGNSARHDEPARPPAPGTEGTGAYGVSDERAGNE
jgi:hypothetical protein